MRPLGSRRRNQSFFCSLVIMLLKDGAMLAIRAQSHLGGSGEGLHQSLSPFGTIDVMQLLEHNLHLLPIGGTLCDQVKTLEQMLGPFYFE